MDRQVSIPLALHRSIEIPNWAPGKLRSDDFVYFVWPADINPKDYSIIIGTHDVSGSHPSIQHSNFKNISDLTTNVFLPWVQLNAHAPIGVVPKFDKNLPAFWERLNRGSTYHIPSVNKKSGRYVMQRHGVLTSAASNW